jgi:hypothetical protein
VYQRYAIYWAPRPDSALADFARQWLGGDPETGQIAPARAHHGLDSELVERATASPRRYGCHATMKAPFRLAEGASEEELGQALADFCAKRRHARSGRLRLHRFSRYLALTLSAERAEIDWLAQQCAVQFDRFRAPLDEADRARRSGHLPPSAQRHLDQFGYGDIFDRFMFHITLAGPLDEAEMDKVEAALAPDVQPFTREPFVVEDLCLFGDPGQRGLFRVVGRYPLKE